MCLFVAWYWLGTLIACVRRVGLFAAIPVTQAAMPSFFRATMKSVHLRTAPLYAALIIASLALTAVSVIGMTIMADIVPGWPASDVRAITSRR
jgi:hypothetical protein